MAELNSTPNGERTLIGIFGTRNCGKSSLINALANQQLAIVSPIKGTTTDPVFKAMEILPLGPVLLADTPGLDDTDGELGYKRIQKAYDVLRKVDIALIVIDSSTGITADDEGIISQCVAKKINFILVFNKSDIASSPKIPTVFEERSILVSAKTGENIDALKNKIAALAPEGAAKPLVKDLVQPRDLVLLVVPLDESAPKGRLILPQQQVIRELLDNGSIPLVCKDTELEYAVQAFAGKIKLVITDSQVFAKVAALIPEDIPLTSFSILFARYKGNLNYMLQGAELLKSLTDGDRVLIAEGCTHHRQCGDIGSQKIPALIKEFCGAEPHFVFTSGGEFPEYLGKNKLIIHCGGCMLNEQEMRFRLSRAIEQGIPMTNYGMAIAYMNGILSRAIKPLKK